MIRRWGLIAVSLVLLTVMATLSFSMTPALAQDAEPTATPITAEIGTGGTNITFWNGLTGSDGVTLNEMLADRKSVV